MASAPLFLHQAQALVDLEHDGDGEGVNGDLAAGRRLAMRAKVEIEARHPRVLHRRQARDEAAIIAKPRADIHAFCEPVTTTSTPHASISNGTAPRPDTLSTRIEGIGCLVADGLAANSGMGFITPVDVSLWVNSTAFVSGMPRSRSRISSAAAMAPFASSLLTSAPYTPAMLAKRSRTSRC